MKKRQGNPNLSSPRMVSMQQLWVLQQQLDCPTKSRSDGKDNRLTLREKKNEARWEEKMSLFI